MLGRKMKKFDSFFSILGLLLSVLFFSCVVWAATTGLPFTDDFVDANLRDDVKTTADWNTDEGILRLEKQHRQFGPFSSSTSRFVIESNSNLTNAISLGDMDGDGDLDLVEGNAYTTGSFNKLYIYNAGAGNYDPSTNITLDDHNTIAIAIGDAGPACANVVSAVSCFARLGLVSIVSP